MPLEVSRIRCLRQPAAPLNRRANGNLENAATNWKSKPLDKLSNWRFKTGMVFASNYQTTLEFLRQTTNSR